MLIFPHKISDKDIGYLYLHGTRIYRRATLSRIIDQSMQSRIKILSFTECHLYSGDN